MSDKFELGPIQTEWVNSLLNNPKRQYKGSLGRKDKRTGERRTCCLGELCVIAGMGEWEENYEEELTLKDPSSESNGYGILMGSWEKLGLHAANGECIGSTGSLVKLNDEGTWEDIAKIVMENPENYFTKSF